MIVGHGLMARSFAGRMTHSADVLVHAAGVSNSQCSDVRDFERERAAVEQSLRHAVSAACYVYFSTCSVLDPSTSGTPYVSHKIAMEALVRAHPGHLILRLPQVAGVTPNPHTLLNFLHARIARGERFSVWRHARRNVIDSADVRALGLAAIDAGIRAATLNIACVQDYTILEIVETMERVVAGHAVYDVVEQGAVYPIDIEPMRALLPRAGVSFEGNYLDRVLRKYYGPLL